jgi:hypothetical protein
LHEGVGHKHDHARADSCPALPVRQNGEGLLEVALAFRHRHAAIERDRTKLIDQSPAFLDHVVSRSKRRLHGEFV